MSETFDLVGKPIKHYRVTSLLGEGGMGAVYRAHDTNLDRHVALKVLPPELVGNKERLGRFVQEARAASGLNHPNVVTIYEIGQDVVESEGETHSVHYISMELVEGRTLRALLRSGELELKRALKILAEVADGLGAAHQAGIVHRDVKPENVMIGASGHAKVLDFGLAKLRDNSQGGEASEGSVTAIRATDPGAVMGTVGYMSPEQAQAKPVDHRSDVFALGCMLYEVATGRRPFVGDSQIDTLHRIIYDKPTPLQDLAPEAPLQLQWILRKALAKDPDERYQSIRDLAIDVRDLIREIDSNPDLATLSGRMDAPPPRSARGPGIALAVTAVIAVVAIVALIWQLRSRPVETQGEQPPKEPAMTSRMVTASGLVTAAAISPDGKYIVHVESWQGEQSLWLRQLSGAQSLELIPAAPVFYWGLMFSNDGDSIVYGLKSDENLDGAFYRISTLGGTPSKLVSGIDSPPTFSPDGTRMAWIRANHPTPKESAIMVANVDGTGERILATRATPEAFAPIFHVAPSWSRDGNRIATAVLDTGNNPGGRILVINADTGEDERVIDGGWPWVAAVGWLPEGDALLAIANSPGRAGGVSDSGIQIWVVPYPSGTPRKVTNDFLDYRIISLTEDGKSLLTVASDATCDIFTTNDGPEGSTRKVSSSIIDGYHGAAFTSDGRIVYSGLANGRMDIWIMNADGSGRRQLTNDQADNRVPRPAGDGVIYLSFGSEKIEIRWVGLDGGPSRAVVDTNFAMTTPAVSPDGRWVIFSKPTEGVSSLWKVPTAGGEPVRLTDFESFLPSVSPDGTKIAFYWVEQESEQFHIGIIPIEGGEMIRSFETYVNHSGSKLRWTRDGEALLVNSVESDRANLWLQPLDGSPPTQLTRFDDLRLRDFDYSGDGQTLLLARGRISRDAVLITGFR